MEPHPWIKLRGEGNSSGVRKYIIWKKKEKGKQFYLPFNIKSDGKEYDERMGTEILRKKSQDLEKSRDEE